MKSLRRPTKTDMLINIFDKIGKSMDVQSVCEITGIKNPNSMKSLFSYIRKSKYVPDENRIDIRIQGNLCIRVS